MLDPAKLAELQRVTQHIKGTIRIDAGNRSVNLTLDTDHPEAINAIPAILSQFAEQLANQLSAYMKIEGEIIEVGGA